MTKIRVVLADDHALVRAGVRMLLESMDDINVVGEAGSGEALLALAAQFQPDLVLMDITMPGINGLEATVQIKAAWPSIRVIVLSMHEDEEYVSFALRNGASGYLLKDAAPKELESAIHAVMAGHVYLSPSVSQAVAGAYVQHLRTDANTTVVLSPRQREVLKLVAQGSSTKEIARLMNLSVKTVETHRTRLMKQLDIHEVTGLVRYAVREGVILAR
jgi:DNA-binding NarL/FixJ family response regulator